MTEPIHRREFLSTVALLSGATTFGGLAGCRDKAKEYKAQLGPLLEEILPLIERDTAQVREGLPKAAAQIVKRLDTDPASDAEGLKRALTTTREEVKELAFSKVTFFAFVAPNGDVLRSEAETDLAAGNSLTKAIPETEKLFKDGAGLLDTFGHMDGLRGVNQGNQLQWVLGMPVVKDGKLIGALIAGWSLRLYAKYLETNFIQALEKKKEDPTKANPLAYVYIVKGKMAYGGPHAPDVNATMLGELDLPSLVKGDALYEASKEVEERSFIIGARRAPKLGDDICIAAMLSPV